MTRVSAEEIAEKLDLEQWFEREGRAYKLTRGRSGMQIHAMECPDPSCGSMGWKVYLNQESGIGNCFACGSGYNKLSFIKAAIGQGWADTFRYCTSVLQEQGWRPRELKAVATEAPPKAILPTSFEIPTADGSNLVYLESRGIDAELAKHFQLRYCVDGWWRFTKEDGTQGGQNFADRLIIPVFDLDGTFQTFQGRDTTGLREPRYLFPKGLPGTGKYLLNGQNAARFKRAVMGEGFFDVAAIASAFRGDPELRSVAPIGSFGKHLSIGGDDDQMTRLMMLKRGGLQELTIMWDGGVKELNAALDAAKAIAGVGLTVRIALLPLGKDPNEVLPEVVRDTYRTAETYSPRLEMRWRLKNPYVRRL